MQVHSTNLLALVTLLLTWIWPATLHAEQLFCTQHGILIEGYPNEDVNDACLAVKGAVPFFRVAGLSMPTNVLIRLVDHSSSPFLDDHEIGHYDGRLRAIVIRDFRTAAAQSLEAEPWLKLVPARDLWRSYIVHELTHAAIHADCKQNCPSRAMHEYIAAVSQLTALSPQSRSRLLDAYPDIGAFEEESEITEIYYALNPRQFAVKAYKHYQKLPDPQGFLRAVLNLR